MKFNRCLPNFPLYYAADDGAANIGGQPPAADPAAPAAAADPEANPFGFKDQPADPPADQGNENAGDQQQENAIPEQYEFKLAEGLEMSDQVKADFTAVAKECKLTQAQADKLVDLHSKIVLDMIQQAAAQQEQWMAETQKMGLNTPAGTKNAKLALDTFGGGGAIQALVNTGAIYNPAVFKMLSTIGSLLSEDNAPEGKPPAAQKSVGDIFFPNSK